MKKLYIFLGLALLLSIVSISANQAYLNKASEGLEIALINFINNPTDVTLKSWIAASGNIIGENERLQAENNYMRTHWIPKSEVHCGGGGSSTVYVPVETIVEVPRDRCKNADLTGDGKVDFADNLECESHFGDTCDYGTSRDIEVCFGTNL